MLTPEEYKQHKAFRDLITGTIDGLKYAGSQGALASSADAAANKWERVDPEFAAVLRDIRSKAWSMPLMQVKPVVEAVVSHLQQQVEALDQQMQ